MFKKFIVATALLVLIGVLIFGAINRTQAKTVEQTVNTGQAKHHDDTGVELNTAQSDNALSQRNGKNGHDLDVEAHSSSESSSLPPADAAGLSAEESAALIYLREEEILAHDVYVTLYAQWGQATFQNISQSEQTHTDEIKILLDRYGLSDPATGIPGVFTNPELQALYDDLVARGSQSLSEALKVGAAIEEIDILDLQAKLAVNDNADIEQVLNNLMNGSYNHLRAFVSTLENQTGETYLPQYLSAEAYQEILSADSQNGRQGGQRHGGKP